MFAQILKENRMNAGIGLRDFAGRIGISPGYLSDLENEKVAPPSEKLILAMARALGIEKDVLLKAAEKVDPEVSFLLLDRKIIDGFLHLFPQVALFLGITFRNYLDKPVVNGFGDFVGEGVKGAGRKFRVVQTGKVQQYMIIALVMAFGALFYYVYSLLRP